MVFTSPKGKLLGISVAVALMSLVVGVVIVYELTNHERSKEMPMVEGIQASKPLDPPMPKTVEENIAEFKARQMKRLQNETPKERAWRMEQNRWNEEQYMKNPLRPTIPPPITKEEALRRINDTTLFGIDRYEAFNWLSKNHRDTALTIAEVKAKDYTNRFDELQNSRPDDQDKKAQLYIGIYAATLMMEEHLEEMGDVDPVEKMRYLAQTAWENKWMHASGGLTRPLCKAIEGRIPEATKGLHPYAAWLIVGDCNNIEGDKKYCPRECAEQVWAIFDQDTSYWALELRDRLYTYICWEGPNIKYLDKMMHSFRAVKDVPESREYRAAAHGFLQQSVFHCLPYSDFLSKAEATENPWFVEMVKRNQAMYEDSLRYCQKRNKP